MLKKGILLTLVVIITLFSLSGCKKDREYDEAEVLIAAKTLIEKSEKINELFYGKGIAIIDDKSYANGNYYMADPLSVEQYGISTVDDMKELVRECFTSSYSNLVINTTLSSVSDDSGIQGLARYYQKLSALDDSPECIMVLNDSERVMLKDTVKYKYDTVRVIGSEGDHVKVTIDVTVINPDDKTQDKTLEIKLLEENGERRIDSPTYTRYTEDMEIQKGID